MQIARFNLAAYDAAEMDVRTAMAAEVDQICRETGFLVLEGHGVSEEVIAGIWGKANEFFALPEWEKARVAPPRSGDPYGWLGPRKEALAKSRGEDTPPDLKESFNGGPGAVPEGLDDADALAFCYAPTPWPDLPGFRDAWQAYYAEMESLAARVMTVFAAALQLPDDFFAPYIDAPISALRALHYPATEGAAEVGQQRAGAHSDYGSLTILLPQPGSRGLEIVTPGGGWKEVPAEPGCFVINIGDLMARWTADRWVSTLHRVVAHPGQPARQSLAFFHQPNWFAEIAPLDGSDRYPPVHSGPYLMDKFRATGS
jgi:isopenicillin N synthase-like dioxygenase